jgi:hypothetical protein
MSKVDKLIKEMADLRLGNPNPLTSATYNLGVNDCLRVLEAHRSDLEPVKLRFRVRPCHKFEYVEWDYTREEDGRHSLKKTLYAADLLTTTGETHVTGYLQRFDSLEELKAHIEKFHEPLGLQVEFIEETQDERSEKAE